MSNFYPDLINTTFPNSIQTFITMLDMTIDDAQAVTGYQQAMRNGDYDSANQYFNQIENGEQKFINAHKINKLIDTCIALQRFYESDIHPYIDSWKQGIEENVDFVYKGLYSSSSSYFKNNFVLYDGNGYSQLFIAIENVPENTLINNKDYWRELTFRGEQGESGIALSFRYEWSSSETYYVDDVVIYNNMLWGCKIQNYNNAPSLNSSYWELIYKGQQDTYPFSSQQPSSPSNGDLWFEII